MVDLSESTKTRGGQSFHVEASEREQKKDTGS
jgi:hypothetical protein